MYKYTTSAFSDTLVYPHWHHPVCFEKYSLGRVILPTFFLLPAIYTIASPLVRLVLLGPEQPTTSPVPCSCIAILLSLSSAPSGFPNGLPPSFSVYYVFRFFFFFFDRCQSFVASLFCVSTSHPGQQKVPPAWPRNSRSTLVAPDGSLLTQSGPKFTRDTWFFGK